MKAKLTAEYGYWCPSCGSNFEGEDWEVKTVWQADSYYSEECSCGNSHQLVEPQKLDVWKCGDGCMICEEDGPSISRMWQCGECKSTYVDREAAGDCCQ